MVQGTTAPVSSNNKYTRVLAESSAFGLFFISVKRTTINLKVTALEVEACPTGYEDHSSLLINEDKCAVL